ncbi:MAG: ABC transporter permease [Bacilli bacterium]|nr:ABC transporter permease [Bacilli bacterium]
MKLFRMFFRSIRDAFKSVFRNFSLSLASISCISITLVIIALALLISLNVNNFTRLIKKDVTIVVFINQKVNEEKLAVIKAKLEQISNIENIEYKTREQLKNEMMATSNELEAIMNEYGVSENPLKDTFQITVKEIEKIDETASIIKSIEGVDSINYGESWVNKLVSAFKILEKGTIVAVILLVLVNVFLIINTIKLTIFSRKREISIMRVVGASNLSIKMPFVIEGMILGGLGAVIPILLIIYGYFVFYNHFEGQLFSPIIKLVSPTPFIYGISLAILAIGIVVGMIGSSRAVRKYLKI